MALTWGTTKMSEKMMAASRGNRLSGCRGEETASVSGWDHVPMEDLDKHMGQWGPQGLHNFLGPFKVTRPKVFPHPHLGEMRGHTDPLGDAHLQRQLTAQFGAPASGKEILRRPGLPKLCKGPAQSLQCAHRAPLTVPPAHLRLLTGQVAPRLPHAPHRGVLCLLPARCSQERVILQLGEALGAADEKSR